MALGRMSKVARICVALTMVAAPAALLAAPASASATAFINTTPILLQDPSTPGTNPAQATVYPSTISVSGQTGTIGNLSVTLSRISYNDSQALSVLLVGPHGSLVLLSDAGGDNSATGVDLTLADSASAGPPETGLQLGTYKPTDYV